MSAEQEMDPIVEVWLKETSATPYGTRQGVSRVMARARRTRQRGRWWPLSSFQRAHEEAPTDKTSDYQATPIPATSGHTPTVIGRTQSMFSPVKAITAGALIFAIGGVMLIAQPFDQQGGSVPGAATDDPASTAAQTPSPDPMAAAHVTGQFHFTGRQIVNATLSLDDGVTRYRGGETWKGLGVEASDPRLDGVMTSTFDRDIHPGTVGVVWGTSTITNDAGSWTGPFVYPITTEGFNWEGSMEFTGSGAYEGLSAILLQETDASFEGVILPGPIPPAE